MSPGWSNFYFLVGSAAAGLIGLMFVVVTLTAGGDRARSLRGAALYLTPTIFHFAAVFALSAITQAPGLSVAEIATATAVVALAGLACCLRSAHGILRAPAEIGAAPHWSDFWLYAGLPAGLYTVLAGLAVAASQWSSTPRLAALVLLILLLLGIRNAWDTITWIAPRRGLD